MQQKCMYVKVTQSCLTLCDPMNYTVHGILKARILEWVAYPSPEDLPNPGIELGSPALQADSLSAEPPGKPHNRSDIVLNPRLVLKRSCKFWFHPLKSLALSCREVCVFLENQRRKKPLSLKYERRGKAHKDEQSGGERRWSSSQACLGSIHVSGTILNSAAAHVWQHWVSQRWPILAEVCPANP